MCGCSLIRRTRSRLYRRSTPKTFSGVATGTQDLYREHATYNPRARKDRRRSRTSAPQRADVRTVQQLLGYDSVRTTEKHSAHFVAAHQAVLDSAIAAFLALSLSTSMKSRLIYRSSLQSSPRVGYISPWQSAADTNLYRRRRQVDGAQREPHLTALAGAQVNPLKTTQTSYRRVLSRAANV